MKTRFLSLATLALLAACASSPTESSSTRGEVRTPSTPADAAPETAREPDPPQPPVVSEQLAPAAPVTSSGSNPEPAPASQSDGNEITPQDPPPLSCPVPGSDPASEPRSSWAFYRERYDTDGDGRITRDEYTRSEVGFHHLDANGDGVISGVDFAKRFESVRRPGGQEGSFYVEREPRTGVPAPEFRLTTTAGEEIDLAQFRGKKPVVLVFGSFT